MFCPNCGQKLSEIDKICPNCKQKVHHDDKEMQNIQPVRPEKQIIPSSKTMKRRSVILVIILGIIVFAAVLSLVLVMFKPWAMGSDKKSVQMQSIIQADASTQTEDIYIKMNIDDWAKYNGNWTIGKYTLSFEAKGEMVKSTIRDEDKSCYQTETTLENEMDSLDLFFSNEIVTLWVNIDGGLCAEIDGRIYDAILTNSLPPETNNQENMVIDDDYLFYSSSGGTRSTNDNLGEMSDSQRFWPIEEFAIAKADLDRLTQWEINIIKNEVYARHGYSFEKDEWNTFFSRFNWYQPSDNFTESSFSKLEQQNLNTIDAYEREKGWI